MSKVNNNSLLLNLIRAATQRHGLVSTVLLTGFIILFAALSLIAPNYDWDVIAYLTNASQITTGLSAIELQGQIYEQLHASLPASAYETLIGSESRLVISQDPEAFRQTVSFFYDSRVIYTYIIAGLIKLGIDPVTAIYAFSVLCSALSVCLLYRLIPVKTPLGLYLVVPFVALSCGLLVVARFATPDAFAALTTITLYFLLLRNRVALLLVLIPLVIFVRTDMILLSALFFAYFFFTNRISKLAIVASGLATLAAYLYLNNVVVDADPWSSLIGYNFDIKPTHPEEYAFDMTVTQYLSYIAIGILSFSYTPLFFVFCTFVATGIVLFSSRFLQVKARKPVSLMHSDLLFLVVSSAVYFAMHFVLFPVAWTRFFAAQYSMVPVVVVWATFSMLAERNVTKADNPDLLSQ